MGGVKLKNNIDYNRKVEYYSKVSKRFSEKVPDELKDYYLPSWENDKLWKKQHERLDHQVGGPTLKKSYPTPETFRDYCFEEAEKDGVANCNGTADWCSLCGRDKSWST